MDNKGEFELTRNRLQTSALFSLVQLLKGGATTIVEITAMAPSRFEVPRDEAPTLAELAGELGARIYVSHKFRAGKRYLDDDGVGKYHWGEQGEAMLPIVPWSISVGDRSSIPLRATGRWVSMSQLAPIPFHRI